MKTGVSFLIVASVLLTVIASAQENKKPSASLQPPSNFTELPAPPTTAKPTTTTPKPTTTTPKPTTTTPKPTTTTTKRTTTTPKPTTTTPKPTTTPAKHTTATTKHTTATTKQTTTAKTTTTPKPTVPGPTPDTNATVSNYSCADGNMNFKAIMKLQIRVNESKTGGVFIVQQSKTNLTCPVKNNTMTLKLTFSEGDITFVFQRNMTSKAVYVNSLDLNLKYAFKTGDERTYTAHDDMLELFKAAIGHSYSCTNDSIYLGKNIFLDITNERIQAFNTNQEFGLADLCKADQPDYTVAIAVGIVLVILIIIVILAYACSRRRRTDGYQSL